MAQVPDKITKLIEQFLHELEINQIHTNKVILFGSYTNGPFNEWSDIDLALVSDSFKGMIYDLTKKKNSAKTLD